MKNRQKYFIGIDLGGKEKKTTGICILDAKDYCEHCKDVIGKNVFKTINSYLEDTEVIAIDAPLTKGRGKGRMRLYEKFLSTKEFRQEKVNPIPPALMPKLCDFAVEIVKKLEKEGFVLDINLIGVFPTLVKKICPQDLFLKDARCQTENQKSALICAKIAFLHSQLKTRYLGYKDGFLFLPALSFWKKEWRQKFYEIWKGRPRLKYYRLITNVFVK